MMPDITMPRLSDSMEEGAIATWLVDDGAAVHAGQEIVEIDTDKTTVAFEAEQDGILRHGAQPGESVAVGARIGAIDAHNTVAASDSADDPPAPEAPTPVPESVVAVRRQNGTKLPASPTAIRLARRINVPLEHVSGSGDGGRVLRRDVIAAHEANSRQRTVASDPVLTADRAGGSAAGAATTRSGNHRVRLTRAQRLLAERMTQSKQTVPEFTVTRDMDLGPAREFRAAVRARGLDAPSFNAIVVWAVAGTLPNHPLLYARYVDGEIAYSDEVNIGVAVSTDAVLHAPVIRQANRLSLNAIGDSARRLSQLARNGHLSADDVVGATFTVSNLGMYGVRHFTAIINAGQAAILAVGGVREDVVVNRGVITTGWRCEMTLTCDHRIVYGAHAAAFLEDVEARLRAPDPLS